MSKLAENGDRNREALERLLAEIRSEMRMTRYETGRDRLSAPVEAAMREVARHEFVPEAERPAAYANIPLPIGDGQTISQPFIVALMTEMLDLRPDAVCLEIGAGSGYQAAILSRLAARVFTVELRGSLAESARERLHRLGCTNVQVLVGDGYLGWPDEAPYDAIMVTAAAPYIPPALIEQLKPGGRMMIPVGSTWGRQELQLVVKTAGGETRITDVLGVAFVPLVPGKPAED